MDFNQIYHLVFETYAGVGILVGAGLVISIILCVIFEARTRKLYKDHQIQDEDDEWSIFGDEVIEAEKEEAEKLADK